MKYTLLLFLATVTVALAQTPGQTYRLPRQITAASTPAVARLVHNLNFQHTIGDMQGWNQETMKAHQQNEVRVLQAGTIVMVDRVQGDITGFRVGKNPTELYAVTSDLK
jgi:hypothetical protein